MIIIVIVVVVCRETEHEMRLPSYNTILSFAEMLFSVCIVIVHFKERFYEFSSVCVHKPYKHEKDGRCAHPVNEKLDEQSELSIKIEVVFI